MQCTYLFLSLHCKSEPSSQWMQGQPTDQWQTHFGYMIQAVTGQLLGQAWLLTTPHTQRLFLGLFLAVVFNSLHFKGVFLPFGVTQFRPTFWPACSFARQRMITSNFKIRYSWEGAMWCCHLAVLSSFWALSIQWLVEWRLYWRELNTGDQV